MNEQPPKQKSKDELQAEELKQAIDQASKDLEDAKKAMQKEFYEGARREDFAPVSDLEWKLFQSKAEGRIIPKKRQEINVTPAESAITPPAPAAPPNVRMREDTRRTSENFPPTAENERVGLRAETRVGETRPMTNVTPPQTPTPPKPPAPTPIPQAPKEEPRWKRFIKRWWKFGVAGVAVGAAGTYIGNKTSEREPQPPTPAFSPATNADIEERIARLERGDAVINNYKIVNVEGGNGTRSRTRPESTDIDNSAEIAKIKAKMEEQAKKHAEELAKLNQNSGEKKQMTADEAMQHNINIQKNWPKNVNMGGFIVPGDPNNPKP